MSNLVFKCTESEYRWRKTRPEINGGCRGMSGAARWQERYLVDGNVQLRI